MSISTCQLMGDVSIVKLGSYLRIGVVWKYSEIWEYFGSFSKIGVVSDLYRIWSKSKII